MRNDEQALIEQMIQDLDLDIVEECNVLAAEASFADDLGDTIDRDKDA